MLSIFNRNHRGFTLIELMIVVVIVGILASLAIPRFMTSTTKTKQTEAKQTLKHIYTMQRQHRQANDSYWGQGITASAAAPTNFEPILVNIGPTAIYTYTINTADAVNLLVTATCGILDDDDVVDTWTMNDGGTLTCTSNDAGF